MDLATVNAVFEYSVNPSDLGELQKKLPNSAVRGLTETDWRESFQPADALIKMPGAGSSFGPCAEWVVREALETGHRHAGLSFNGMLPIVEMDPNLSPGALADKLSQTYDELRQAASEAYEKTPEYARQQDESARRKSKSLSEEQASFSKTMDILSNGAPSLDTDPEFYSALGKWIIARDHVSADSNGEHRKELMAALIKAGFVNNEGVGVPSVADQSDTRMLGRYYVGQAINMGASTSGPFAGGIHPLLGERMEMHGQDKKLSKLHAAAPEGPAFAGIKDKLASKRTEKAESKDASLKSARR